VPRHHPTWRTADHARAKHEFQLPHVQHLASDDAGVGGPTQDGQREDDGPHAWPEADGEQQRYEDAWKCHAPIRDAHQERVRAPADVAGCQAKHQPGNARKYHHGRGDAQ
jgi:hypothetical protein